jgi:DNA-binding NtrC family response regulator
MKAGGGGTERAIERLRAAQALSRFIGEAPCFVEVISRLPLLARSDASVVILGETGTGKELVARALHYLGPRAERPFVPVNCGSIPDNLLEDELFGHERGAFTDARQRRQGLVVQADGGTLFLDEVDSLTPRAQVTLLRVLQDRTVRALGAERFRTVNVRFVAASHADLMQQVTRGTFRSDLYYRLCVLHTSLPPLRERGNDVLMLANHFLLRYTPEGVKRPRLTAEAEDALRRYPWPGTVRELENAVQRAVALLDGRESISAADLGLAPIQGPGTTGSFAALANRPFVEAKRAVVTEFEREYLLQLMQASAGNVTRAARWARKERRDLGRLLRKHQINPRGFV